MCEKFSGLVLNLSDVSVLVPGLYDVPTQSYKKSIWFTIGSAIEQLCFFPYMFFFPL